MTTRKNQNSILVLTTLGIYLGLVLVGAALPAAAQRTSEDTTAAADQFGVFINKRPTRDFSKSAVVQIESKKVDLNAAFKVTIKGTVGLANDGKTYILKTPTQVPGGNTGDPAMQKLAQDAILAVGDAGWLGYLKAFDKTGQDQNITISVEQNETQFQARIVVEQRDVNSAKTISSALGSMISLAGSMAKGDEAIFVKSTTAMSEGKDLCLNFASPKKVMREMIERKIAEQKEASK